MALRTESLTIRIDPKVKYLASLAASTARLSLSSFIERALDEKIQRAEVWEGGVATKLSDILREIWADHEADRFALLADRLPSLLSEEQQVLWGLIQSRQELWLQPLSQGLYNVSRVTFNFKALREQWDELKAEARKKPERTSW